MNQVELDLTYRLDALKAGCNQYGWESEWCITATQAWLEQHNMNTMNEKYGDYMLVGIFIVLLFFSLLFLMSKGSIYLDAGKNQSDKPSI